MKRSTRILTLILGTALWLLSLGLFPRVSLHGPILDKVLLGVWTLSVLAGAGCLLLGLLAPAILPDDE